MRMFLVATRPVRLFLLVLAVVATLAALMLFAGTGARSEGRDDNRKDAFDAAVPRPGVRGALVFHGVGIRATYRG